MLVARKLLELTEIKVAASAIKMEVSAGTFGIEGPVSSGRDRAALA
jgi:hypothetical protein